MNKNILLWAFLGLGTLALVFLVWALLRPPQVTIASFEDCSKQGYPILESYPRQCKTPDGRTFVEIIDQNGTTPPPTTTPPNNGQQNISDLIQVDEPKPNETLMSPVTVTGKARGNWYFEASFPAHVVDANGTTLGTAPIQAQGEWMTTQFVPFEGSVPFTAPTTETGFLVFEKDNPSGLPENDREYRISVRFQNIVSTTTTVKVFFHNRAKLTAGQDDCTTVFPVERVVSSTPAIGRAALLELLSGVSTTEGAQGFSTSLSAGIQIQSLTIENGVATVDFNSALDQNIGGSCRVSAIRAQITQTLKQFPTVTQVVISRNGLVDEVLQP